MKIRAGWLSFAACFALAVSFGVAGASPLVAQMLNPAYLREMPSVDRVLADMRTTDPAETAARQMGALLQLKQMIEECAGPRFYDRKVGLTPDETRLRQMYYTAYYQIAQSKPEYKGINALRGCDISPQFRNQLFQRYFSAAFVAQYKNANAAARARTQARLNADRAASDAVIAASGGLNPPRYAPAQPAGGQPSSQPSPSPQQASAPADQGVAPDTQVGNFLFAMPTGWKPVEKGDSTFVYAPSQPGGAVTDLALSTDDLVGDLQNTFRVEWEGFKNSYRILQGGQIAPWRSNKGYGAFYTTAVAADNNGTRWTVFVLGAQYKNRIQIVLFQSSLPAGATLSAYEKVFQQTFLASLTFGDALPGPHVPPPQAPGGAAAIIAAAKLAVAGDAAKDKKGYVTAIADYQKALALDPALKGAYTGIALAYDESQQGEKAIPAWTYLTTQETDNVQRAKDFFSLAEDYPASRNDDAVKAYRSAVVLVPNYEAAWRSLGRTYNTMEQYDNAIAPLRQAVRLRPDDDVAWEFLGYAHYSSSHYQEAVTAMQQAIGLNGNLHTDPQLLGKAYLFLGISYVELGKKFDALAVYSKLLSVDKEDAEKLHEQISKMDSESAASNVVQASQQSRAPATTGTVRVGGLSAQVEAIVTGEGRPVSNVIVVFTDSGTGRSFKVKTDANGKCSLVGVPGGDYQVEVTNASGGTLSSRITAISSEESGALSMRIAIGARESAGIQLSQGQASQSGEASGTPAQEAPKYTREQLEEIKKQNEKVQQINVLIQQAQAAISAKNWKEAISPLQQLIAIDPGNWQYYSGLGDAETNLGQYDQAVDAYQKGVQAAENNTTVDPRNPSTDPAKKKAGIAKMLTAEGNALLKLHKNNEAIGAYTKAASMDPNPAVAYFNLCATQYNTGNADGALDSCDKAIAADPNKADAYFIKGSLLIASSKTDASGKVTAPPGTADALNKYLDLAPNGPHAKDVKVMLEYIGSRADANNKNRGK
jgi:tetratricopeptide (TPR) repeat protein